MRRLIGLAGLLSAAFCAGAALAQSGQAIQDNSASQTGSPELLPCMQSWCPDADLTVPSGTKYPLPPDTSTDAGLGLTYTPDSEAGTLTVRFGVSYSLTVGNFK